MNAPMTAPAFVDRKQVHTTSVLLTARSVGPSGGVITYMGDICAALLNRGDRVSLVINREAVDGGPLELIKDDIDVHYVTDGSDSPSYEKGLAKVIESVRPQIIHVNENNRRARQRMPRALRTMDRSIRKLVTLHGDVARLGGSQSLISGGLRCGIEAFRKRIELRQFLSSFHHAISVSEFIGTRLPSALFLPRRMFTSIPNGVDTEKFSPAGRTAREGIVFGCVGGLSYVKRFDVALRAFAALKKTQQCAMKIAGEDCGERASLMALANEIGIASSVQFVGVRHDIPSFLQEIDIFVCPSDSETSCFAQAEAMAAGLPSVSSRYADLSIRVRHGIDGYLATPGNVEEFARYMAQLRDDHALRAVMGARARERILERYSRERYMLQTLQVYDRLLGQRCGVSV